CKRFKNVREWISDELKVKENHEIKDYTLLNNVCNNNNFLNNSCNNNNFKSELDRISAGCLYLLDEFIKDCGLVPPPARNNINIVDYILIWLSYMLNLGKSEEEEDNITGFYITYINICDKYNTGINGFTDYESYRGLIDTKLDLLYMDSNIVSKFYKAFKSLCEMYNELDDENNDCNKYLEDNNEFLKEYELNEDTSITENNYYIQLLSTLSNDYDNLKNECKNAQERKLKATTEMDTPQDGIESTEGTVETEETGQIGEIGQNYDATSSSSSIVSKLIPVVLIFAAISIFLGISYKYSLFGFRKRFKKQQIREKIKNIKKKMNH
ncbi:hypothetical protein YYC_04793, partial [Plasmodium yoelii 17X]